MADGIDFSLVRSLAQGILDRGARDQDELDSAGHVLRLTDPARELSPDDRFVLANELAYLGRRHLDDDGIRDALRAANDALEALTGPATGRPPDASAAAQLAGSAPPSAVPPVEDDTLRIVQPTRSTRASPFEDEEAIRAVDEFLRANRERLAARYPDQWVAVTDKGVVAAAGDEESLFTEVASLQESHGPFYVLIDNPSRSPDELVEDIFAVGQPDSVTPDASVAVLGRAVSPMDGAAPAATAGPSEAAAAQIAGAAPPSAVPATAPADRTDPPPSIDWTDRVFVVIGAGPMGRGIAYNFLLQFPGAKVRLCEFKSEILQEAQAAIEGIIADGIRRGKLTSAEADRARANITYWDGKGDPAENGRVIREAVQGATAIQEAIVEKIEPKLALFRILGEAAPDDALIFTNTSAYTVSELEAVMEGKPLTAHHYFNPAYKMKLVERARGQNPLSAGQEDLLRRYERQLGKVILEAPDTSGFYVNRFFVPLLNAGVALFDEILGEVEALKARTRPDSLQHGLTELDLMVLVDTTTRQALGSPQGPFELLDMTKPHITHHASNVMAERLGRFYAPVGRLDALIAKQKEKGLFGYPILDARKPVEPESLERLQTALGEDKVATLQRQIQERTWAVLARVVDNLISERIAAGVSPEQAVRDIQIASTVGVGYRAGAIAVMNGVGIERARTLAGTIEGEGLKPVAFLDPASLVDGKIPIRLVNLDVVDGVARIRIENPGKRNVLNPEVVAQLTAAFDRAEQDASVTMIVFEGLGGDLAGADIKFFTDNLKKGAAGLAEIMRFVANGLALYSKIEQSKKRTVAVLDGGTFGGGFELALAANEIIVTPQAKLALPETGLGIIPGLRGADRLALRIGEGLAFYFMATGNTSDRTIAGKVAHEVGIADYLVERSDLDARLAEMAGTKYRGERPRVLADGHPLKLIAEIFSNEVFRRALINGDTDPEFEGRRLSESPEHYAQYMAALEIARQRPRAALALADRLLSVDNNDDDYQIVEQVFLTPMALQGLSTMGRGIQVANRTRGEWGQLLFDDPVGRYFMVGISEGLFRAPDSFFDEPVAGPVIDISHRPLTITLEDARDEASTLMGTLNRLDVTSKLNDLARVNLFFDTEESRKQGETRHKIVISRSACGGPFQIVAQASNTPASATPAASSASGDVSSATPVAPGRNLVVGGEVVSVTDESFAEARNLLDPGEPAFDFGDFDARRGQRFSSWETRRHSREGREEAVIKLGQAGPVRLVVIDTKWHDGNQAQAAGLLASKDGVNWTRIVAPIPLQGHSLHAIRVANNEEWNFVKLEMYPDGGIARLRLYSDVPQQWEHLKPHHVDDPKKDDIFSTRHPEVISKPTKDPFKGPDPETIARRRAETDWEQSVNLTSAALGAKVIRVSDERYSHAANVLRDEEPQNMGDGLENARFRLPLEDVLHHYEKIWDHAEWVEIAMSDRGTIQEIETDFRFFNFNNPMFLEVEACDLAVGQSPDQAEWTTIVPKQSVKGFASEANVKLASIVTDRPFTHIRVKIYPCGGVHRIRAIGTRVATPATPVAVPVPSTPAPVGEGQGVSAKGDNTGALARGRDDRTAEKDSQRSPGRSGRRWNNGIGRGSSRPEVEEREDRRPERPRSSDGRQDSSVLAKIIYVRALHKAKELGLEKVFRALVDQEPEKVLTFVRHRKVGRQALDQSLTRAGLPPRETLKALMGNSRSMVDAVALEYVLYLSRATDPHFSWLAARFNKPGSPLAHGLWGSSALPAGATIRSVILH